MLRFLSVPGAVEILAHRVLILKPWAPTVALHTCTLAHVSEHSTCKLNYKLAILASRALILEPWVPTAFLQKLVEVSGVVAVLAPRALILKPWAQTVFFTKVHSGF